MCPSFKHEICEVVRIEPERIQCADKITCRAGEWEKCPVFIAGFFASIGTAVDRGAPVG